MYIRTCRSVQCPQTADSVCERERERERNTASAYILERKDMRDIRGDASVKLRVCPCPQRIYTSFLRGSNELPNTESDFDF